MQSLQGQLKQVQEDLLAERANGQQKDQDKINSLESQEASLLQQIMVEHNQEAHAGRVQEATTEITTYFDTLYVGGQTMRELCSDEEAYQILRLSVSQAFIDQATKNSEVLSQVQTESQTAIKQANDRAMESDDQNTKLVQENHRLNLELTDVTSRFEAATNLLNEAPSSEETEKLKQEIADLKAQLALKAKADEPKGDAKSQIDAMVEARENRKVKITNLRLADPSGINTKNYIANDVLTGEELEIHSNYIRSYKEVSAEEAEQIRADEANKKAELELQNAVIPTIQEPIELLSEVVETSKETPFPEVQTTDNGEVQGDQGNESLHEVVAEESEVDVKAEQIAMLQSFVNELNTRHIDLSLRVYNLESKQAVA